MPQLEKLEFIIGQRWISNTESELGLGMVAENNGRLITISFPAAGERRTYAIDNAPLSRVEYSVGDQIRDDEGNQIIVSERNDHDGIYIYSGLDENDKTIQIDELDLDSFVQFSKPQDRLFAGQVDKNKSFQLRVETLALMRKHQESPAYGLLGPRVQLLPHQFYIANQVSRRHSPRVLLADEVGLGKTIEAGLILHHQIITGSAARVLIVVPDSLVHQWLVEMLRRFNLYFTILDDERCFAIAESEEGNPFESSQLVLCSLSFLVNNPERHTEAMEADWDLMIVDEAHHLLWSEQSASPEYRCIESLAAKIASLLLLTATPEQLGLESHFARLRLLDPDRYYDLNKFREEESGYQEISLLVDLLSKKDIKDQLQNNLPGKTEDLLNIEKYLGKDFITNLLADDEHFQQKLEVAINDLIDRHGTGRVLFRNTRDAVKGFPERKLISYPLESKNDLSTIDQIIHPELVYGQQWLSDDPRVEWFCGWLQEYRNQKILVICSLAQTALELEEYLRTRVGIRSAVFHEGMSLVNRDRAAAYFADDEEGAQILICSEIGSEGRNFQFSHHLVLFDLPFNPDLLEQRIGRLDRIGQTETIQIHVAFYQGTSSEGLLRWYHEGLNAIERVCPVSSNVFQSVREALEKILLENNIDDLNSLIKTTHEQTELLLENLQHGRNKLLELSSCHPQHAAEVIENVTGSTSSLELESYMEKIFDQFGVDHQVHSQHAVVLHPGDHMTCHSFPGLSEDGMTATYQRATAMIREDMQFLSWEHPMVSGATDMILDGDFGNTAFCTLKLAGLKAGTLILEAIFIVHCPAPKNLQLHRYLPMTTIRIVVDSLNRDLSEALPIERLNRLAERVSLQSVHEVIKYARPQINELIVDAEKRSVIHQDKIIKEALVKMMDDQDVEINRLESLSKVNASIRADEIEYMKNSRDLLQQYMQGATLKLDAIRVALAT
ncbi:MAG: RNA polymerase-associated protein RapA [Gammaproteobacteria bacterium]